MNDIDRRDKELRTLKKRIKELENSEIERKQLDLDLQVSEEKFRALYQNFPDMYVSFNPVDATIFLCNNTLLEKTGYSRDEILGSRIFKLYHKECRDEAHQIFLEFTETGQIRDRELVLVNKNGDKIDVSLNMDSIMGQGGKIIFSMSSWRDISRQKKVERELEFHRNRLEELVTQRTTELEKNVQKLQRSQKAMLYMVEDLNRTSRELKTAQDQLLIRERLAVLGQFSGNISHELRNPLGVIGSSAFYLKKVLKEPNQKVVEHLQKIESNVNTASAIIQSMLNLTRMKKPAMAKCELIPIISSAINDLKIPAAIRLVRDFPTKKLFMYGEVEQIRMALKNILKNAKDSIKKNGTVSVSVTPTTDCSVKITVKDTGCGIASKDLKQVFQPLFSTKTHGIGFGLSITKMIVDNHGGSIEVESVPGEGTTFILCLPLYVKEGASHEKRV